MQHYFVSFLGADSEGMQVYGNISFKCTLYLDIRDAEEKIKNQNNLKHVAITNFIKISEEEFKAMNPQAKTSEENK